MLYFVIVLSEYILMEISVTKIKPREDSLIEAEVYFWDGSKSPHFSCYVTVFVEAGDSPLSQLQALAIEKAKEFLSSI